MNRLAFLASSAAVGLVAVVPLPVVAVEPVIEAAPSIWEVNYSWYIARSAEEARALYIERVLEDGAWYEVDGVLYDDDDERVNADRILVKPDHGILIRNPDGTTTRCMEFYFGDDNQPAGVDVDDEGIAYIPIADILATNQIGHYCDEA